MKMLLARRIPVAWFLLGMIVLAAAGVGWLMVARYATPASAVLIYSAPSSEAGASTGSPGARAQSAEVAPESTQTPQLLAVYVSGEVVQPGVYSLPAGSRVADAVAASGGFTSVADQERINLAARLSDEQHITVPRLGETIQAADAGTPATAAAAGDGDGSEHTNSEPGATAGTPGSKVNINTASARELEALPGIGEVLAQRIVTYREANGPFKRVDDLMLVPGIKEGLMSGLRDLVSVGP